MPANGISQGSSFVGIMRDEEDRVRAGRHRTFYWVATEVGEETSDLMVEDVQWSKRCPFARCPFKSRIRGTKRIGKHRNKKVTERIGKDRETSESIGTYRNVSPILSDAFL